ncbi:MAG: hypothetical protein V1672_02925 [Candidatus Diapherotrites archaeon]
MKKVLLAVFVLFLLIAFTSSAFAIQQLMALHGQVTDTGNPIVSGNLRVYIYDDPTAGNLIYDSASDYDGSIVNGIFDVMLGDNTTLDLNYGTHYYMDLAVDGTDLDFGANERQRFESSHGLVRTNSIMDGTIANADIASDAAIAWSKVSKTGSNLSDIGWDSDFNTAFVTEADGNNLYVLQTDGNTWYYNRTDVNSLFVKQADGNVWYPRLTESETITGTWDFTNSTTFSGGFGSNGATIQDGILYVQSIVIVNDFNAATVQGIDINGHHTPSIDNTWDLGSDTKTWRTIYGTDANFTTISVPADAITWTFVNKSGSNLTDIETRNHNDLQSMDGGTTAEYYHLTNTQHSNLTALNGVWVTINSNSGSTSANAFPDTLNIYGSDDINVSISGDTVTIDYNGSVAGSITDTNWSTSWSVFDTNLSNYYWKQSDLNAYLPLTYYTQTDANNVFVKISDTNNTGRLTYTVIADAPWTTSDTTGILWAELDALTPWADGNVADDITLTNLTQITTRAYSDLQGTPYIPTEAAIDANAQALINASDTNAATACDNQEVLLGDGTCLSRFTLDTNIAAGATGILWAELDALTPWADGNVADDITLTNISQITTKPIWSLGNVADLNLVFVKQSDGNTWYIKTADANTAGRLTYTVIADAPWTTSDTTGILWAELDALTPWADGNVADDITLTNVTQITNRNIWDMTNVSDLAIDTNAATACDNQEVLLGDGTCLSRFVLDTNIAGGSSTDSNVWTDKFLDDTNKLVADWNAGNVELEVRDISVGTNITVRGNISAVGDLDVIGDANIGTYSAPNQPMFRAFMTSAMSDLTNNVWTEVNIDDDSGTVGFDPKNKFNTTTHAYTPVEEGYYLVYGQAYWSTNITTNKRYNCSIYKNGASVSLDSVHSSDAAAYLMCRVTDLIYLDSNDYIEFYVRSLSGDNTADIAGGTTATYFFAHKIS